MRIFFKYDLSSVYNFITCFLVFEVLIQTRGIAPEFYFLCISKACLLHSLFFAVASCITLQKKKPSEVAHFGTNSA